MKGPEDIQCSNPADVGEVGVKEGIGSGWSQGFGLDELNVWHECWWKLNLWLVNWHLYMGHKTLGGGWGRVQEMGVGWGVWSWPILRTNSVGVRKCFSCAWMKGFGKV